VNSVKNLSKNDKLILIGLSFIVGLFLYYQFLLNPLLNKISDIKLSIEQNQTLAEEISNMERSNRLMAKSIEELKVEYEKFKQSLPIELRDPEIQTMLNFEALNSKVKINNLNFGEGKPVSLEDKQANVNAKEVEKGSLMVVPVTINLQGDYVSAMNYIVTLEKSERISEVKTINIVKSPEGINLGVIINYYYVAGDEKDKQELDYKVTVPIGGEENLFN
jgi:Tfp pilus assembly protein PilO